MVLVVCSQDLRNPCNDHILSSSSRPAGMLTDALCQSTSKIFKQYQHTLLSKINVVNLRDTEHSIIGGRKGRFRPLCRRGFEVSGMDFRATRRKAPDEDFLLSLFKRPIRTWVIYASHGKCIVQQINLNSCLMYAGSNSDQSITITTHTPTTKPYDSII
jgi:hypothetical protein